MNQRTNQLDRTRTQIIEAATDMIFGSPDLGEVTMQGIADAAGVSHRTLYRYFPSRQDLINEVGRHLDSTMGGDSGGYTDPSDFGTWVEAANLTIAFGATHRDTFRRALLLGIGTGDFRSDRDEMYWDFFRREFSHLGDEEARQDFIAIRHLLSSNNVILIGERFGVSPEEVTEIINRAVGTLVADVERRDQQAAEEAS